MPNFAEPEMDEELEGAEVTAPALTTLMQVSEAEVNQQILTARAYPRNNTSFRRQLQELVCYDPDTALSCLYALKRDGKPIQGPSINFAMSAFQTWGNARCGSSIVDIGEEFITAQGFFWDLEKNTGLAFQVLRRITTKSGQRYGDDMIMTTGNAAGSIAVRNAILKGVPKTAWNPVYQKCRQLSIGEGESIQEKRSNMIKAFAPLNVDQNQIFGLLGVKGLDDVSIEDMIFLGGVLTSIKEGEQTVEQAFSPDNMPNPEQVTPRRPTRSEFQQDGKSGQKKADAPKPADEKKAAPAEENKPADKEPKQQEATQADADEARNLERQDFIKDLYADLAKETSIREVSNIMQNAKDTGVFTEEEEAQFEADCKARSDELYAIAKAKREAQKK
jgi:hypothetical protein